MWCICKGGYIYGCADVKRSLYEGFRYASNALTWRCGNAGIAFVTIIAWIPGHAATYLGQHSQIPGETHGCIALFSPQMQVKHHILALQETFYDNAVASKVRLFLSHFQISGELHGSVALAPHHNAGQASHHCFPQGNSHDAVVSKMRLFLSRSQILGEAHGSIALSCHHNGRSSITSFLSRWMLLSAKELSQTDNP